MESATGKTAKCSAEVDVGYLPVSCTLTANPNAVPLGSPVSLQLKTAGDVAKASIDGTGVAVTGGSVNSNPVGPTVYHASVEGIDGRTSSCSATVNIQYKSAGCSLTANPSTV